MATATATQARSTIPSRSIVDEGITAVKCTYVNAATVAVSDFIAMHKIGHGMTVLDGYVVDGAVGNFDYAFGTSDDKDRFFATASSIGFQRFTQGLPYTFSASDDATRQDIFAGIEIGTGQALSTTATFTMVLFLAKSVENT